MKDKLIAIILIIFIIIINISTISFALDDIITFSTSKTELNPGETFTITISEQCGEGAISVETFLNYNKDVLELINTEILQPWIDYGDGNQVLTAVSNTEVSSGDVFELTFKVNDNTSETASNIVFSETHLYKDYSNIVNIEDETIQISINGIIENTTNDTTNNTISNIANNTINNSTDNATNITNSTDNTTTTAILPNTGNKGKFISLLIITLAGIAFMLYEGYEKYKGI